MIILLKPYFQVDIRISRHKTYWRTKMDMLHETMLSDFIRDICETGAGRIEKRVLLRWFGQEKLSVGIRRDLQQRFEAAILEEGGNIEQWSLLAVGLDQDVGGLVTFAAVDLDDIQKGKGWWVDVGARRRLEPLPKHKGAMEATPE
jgi:hypothetical protein